MRWGGWIEFAGWTCPLAPSENHLRRAVGEAGDAGDYIDPYLWPLPDPAGLTREGQWALGAGVPILDGAVYGALLARRHRARPGDAGGGRASPTGGLGPGMAGRDPIAAPASRRVAVLADRDDTLLEALDRARDPSGRGMAATEPVGMPTHRPRWVLCVGEGAETRRGG